MFGEKIKTVILIDGMSCKHCANKVKIALEKLEHVKKVKVDLSQKKAVVTSNEPIDMKLLKAEIENLDYKVMGIMEKNV